MSEEVEVKLKDEKSKETKKWRDVLASDVEKAHERISIARSVDDVIRAIKILSNNRKELSFRLGWFYFFRITWFPGVIFTIYVAYKIDAFTWYFWVAIFFICCYATTLKETTGKYSKLIPDLEELTLKQVSVLSNGLRQPEQHFGILLYKLQRYFYEYNRGDCSNSLRDVYAGTIEVEGEMRDFRYYHLHYVDRKRAGKRTVTVGGVKFEEDHYEYTHFDRYSFVINGCTPKNIAIMSGASIPVPWTATWTPPLKEFNARFKIYGESEMACARFIRPTAVLQIDKMSRELTELNVEFAANGRMCVSFSNKNLLEYPRPKTSLRFPAQFIDEIQPGVKLPTFQRVLGLVGELAEKCTN